jgi:tetratricopeptide (TPR) repeat protein
MRMAPEMTTTDCSRWALAMACAIGLAAASWPGAAVALQQANDVQVEASKQLLSEERYIEALAVAQDALRVAPDDYRASYYVAMAYMGLQQYDAAEAQASRALDQAPASARSSVEKLIFTIQSLKQGNQDVGAADAALAEGLIGKAARLYEDGWAAGRNAPDYALKAAELYADRLSQPVDAARVLRQVMESLPGSQAAGKAETELKGLQPTLRQIAAARVKEAAMLPYEQARGPLRAAADADPGFADIYLTQAQLAAASGSTAALESALKELARRNLVDLEFLAALPDMAALLNDPGFATQLTDIIGGNQTEMLRTAASPPGRAAYLSRLASGGKLSFFMGARQVQGTNSYKLWSRRKVSSFQRGAGGCELVIGLSDQLGASDTAAAYLPASRVIDLRPATALVRLNGTSIEFGPSSDGWQASALSVGSNYQLAQPVWSALRQLNAACPRPAPKRR